MILDDINDFLDAVSKHPIVENEGKAYLGKEILPKKGNSIIIADKEILLHKDKTGETIITIDGIEIGRFVSNKSENIKKLEEETVFTRADIASSQLEFLNIDAEHEVVIKKLKPILQTYEHSSDLGALLSASVLIKAEDLSLNVDHIKNIHDNLKKSYRHRGLMIYNLFRSNILRIEVLNYLNILKKTYNNDTQKIQAVFLPYWDSIIDGEGYPTAYFVSGFDTKEVFFSEIKKRIRRGSKDIRIYSRTIDRNKKIEKWCKEFSKDNGCLCSKTKTYKLGTTPAVKIRIMKNDS